MDDDQPERAYSRVTTTERDAGAGRQAPAGWFPDPAGIHSQRYWDGQQWTTHVVDRNGESADHFVRVADQPPAGEPIVATVPEPDEATPDDEPLLRLPGSGRPAATVDLTDPTLDSADDDSSQPDDTYAAAAFATRVLERACDIGGVDCRNNAMTADEAIAALPADLAEATVRVMHRTYAAAGDTHNADWALTKLDEIHRGRSRMQPIPPPRRSSRPPAEEPAELRSDAADDAAAVASVTPMFSARARTEVTPEATTPTVDATPPDPAPAPQPTVDAGWYRDPGGRHQHRYWNGAEWTDRVADDTVQADDPLRWEPPGATSSTEPEARAASEVARRHATAVGTRPVVAEGLGPVHDRVHGADDRLPTAARERDGDDGRRHPHGEPPLRLGDLTGVDGDAGRGHHERVVDLQRRPAFEHDPRVVLRCPGARERGPRVVRAGEPRGRRGPAQEPGPQEPATLGAD